MANVKAIEFDDNEDLSAVTIRLSAAEAAYLTKLCGMQSSTSASAVMTGGGDANTAVYDALTRVFNGLHDDGVNDWPNGESR